MRCCLNWRCKWNSIIGGSAGVSSNGGTVQIDSGAVGATGGGGAGIGGDIDFNSARQITGDAVDAISFDAGAASNFVTSPGDLTLESSAATTVYSAVAVHKLASVAVTVYKPAVNPVIVAVVSPLLHKYVIGATPPAVIVTVAVPSSD